MGRGSGGLFGGGMGSDGVEISLFHVEYTPGLSLLYALLL